MIVFSRLGNKGNLGNHMFQIAATVGIAMAKGQTFGFPVWIYAKFFKNKLAHYDNTDYFKVLKESSFKYQDWDIDKNTNYDLNGWLQTERYFDVKATKEVFKFKDNFIQKLQNDNAFLFTKKTILISVRRGDFVNHPHYYQLSFKYYFLALIKNFPDWKERNLIFTSDDVAYCRYHFSFLKNTFFLENLAPIEQLAIGTQCCDFIISNSTFSWWIAWLGEKKQSKIIRPIKNFRGDFAKKDDDSDYFPARWVSFDEKKYKISNEYLFLSFSGFLYNLRVAIKHHYRDIVVKFKSNIKWFLYTFKKKRK